MKRKIFSVLTLAAVISLTFACKSDKKADTDNQTDSLAMVNEADSAGLFAKVDSAKVGSGAAIINVEHTRPVVLPIFSSETVNTGLAKFEPLRKELEAAIAANDETKISALSKSFTAWVMEASTYGEKLTKDENQIYIDTYSKMVLQWEKLMASK
ncbi:MAG: hypothetical protein EOO99_07235 [Pedobacter sp.]|nr:MAG: hypothetical protein EOO99_07235 [Pedobacter sp.]